MSYSLGLDYFLVYFFRSHHPLFVSPIFGSNVLTLDIF